MDLAYFFALQKKSPSPWISNWNKHSTNWRRIGVKFFYYIFTTQTKKVPLSPVVITRWFFSCSWQKPKKKVGGKFRLPFFFHLNGLGARENSNKRLNWILWTNWRRGQFFCIIFYDANKKSLYWWSMRCSKRLSSMLDKLMTHWHQFFVIFYDVNKKSPNHSDALLVQSILT